MKAILYAGATLMIGASIYGVADFRKTSHEKEFRTMYNEVTPSARPETTGTPITEPANDLSVAPEKTRKAMVRKSESSEDVAAVTAPEPNDSKTINEISKNGKTIGLVLTDKPVKAVKKARKFRRELFSRAPIREPRKLVETEAVAVPAEEQKVTAKEEN